MPDRPGGSVCVELLGPVRAWLDGVAVPLGSPMRRATLAILTAGANEIVSQAQLLEGLWGVHRPAKAAGSLHTYIAGLRRALEPDRESRAPAKVLRSVPQGYLLDVEPAKLDLAVLEHYREKAAKLARHGDYPGSAAALDSALGLWQGTALAGVPGPFAERTRVRLTEVRLALVEERAEALLAAGEHRRVAVELVTYRRDAPVRERLAGLLMLAQYRAGRVSDALATFDETRTSLASELGVGPGADLRTLHARVLANDLELDVPAPRARPVVTGGVTGGPLPAQLPHATPDFVGRDAEIAALRALRGRGRSVPTVVVVNGPAGIGKTALAVHYASSITADYPDGQLYVNLGGFDADGNPLPAAEALGRLVRGLGVDPKSVPSGLEGMRELLRAVLFRRKVLVLLDNAASADQVSSLLPETPGSLVIVTSRNRLGGLAVPVQRVTLDVLRPEDALTLLAVGLGEEAVTDEPQAARRLARLCGYWPMALRVAAERIVGRRRPRLADAVAELAEERHLLDALDTGDDETTAMRAVFSWSYAALAPEPARAFRLLGLHPTAGFGLSAATALMGTSRTATRRLLGMLVADNLVEEAGEGRYRLHELLYLYAGERAVLEEPEHARLAAVRRVLAWYLHGAVAAAAVLGPHRPRVPLSPPDFPPPEFVDHDLAYAWWDTERPALIGAIGSAVEWGEDASACRLAGALWVFFQARTPDEDWPEIAAIAVAAARRIGEDRAIALALTDLAGARYRAGDPEGALRHLAEAAVIAVRAGDQDQHVRVLTNLGVVHTGLGNLESALEHLERARAMAGSGPANPVEANIEGSLGLVHERRGNPQEALRHYVAALSACRRDGPMVEEAVIRTRLGELYRGLGMLADARVCFEEATRLADRRGERTARFSAGAIASKRRKDVRGTGSRDGVPVREGRSVPDGESDRALLT